MSIRFPTEAANADVMGEDPADPSGQAPAVPTPYSRTRPAASERGARPGAPRVPGPSSGAGRPGSGPPRGPGSRGPR